MHVELKDLLAYSGNMKAAEIVEVNPELERSAVALVFGRLASRYDTTAWFNTTTTPDMVKRCISMYYVGRYYQQVYSQNVGVSDYGTELLRDLETTLNSIVKGEIDLLPISEEYEQYSFYKSGIAYEISHPKFSMEDAF